MDEFYLFKCGYDSQEAEILKQELFGPESPVPEVVDDQVYGLLDLA